MQASISGSGLIVPSIKWEASHGGPGLISGVNQKAGLPSCVWSYRGLHQTVGSLGSLA